MAVKRKRRTLSLKNLRLPYWVKKGGKDRKADKRGPVGRIIYRGR